MSQCTDCGKEMNSLEASFYLCCALCNSKSRGRKRFSSSKIRTIGDEKAEQTNRKLSRSFVANSEIEDVPEDD